MPLASLLSFAAVLAAAPAAAQPPPAEPDAAPLIFRSDTRLVEVPVVVIDRKSRQPVRGLTAEDFELRENRRVQPIELFSVQDSGAPAPAPPPPAGGTSAAGPVFTNWKPFQQEPTPLVAILVDTFNASFEEQYYAARAAAEVIGKREFPARWGLYVLGRTGLRVLHDYSEDTESLIKRLRRLRDAGGADPLVAGLTSAIDPADGRLGAPNLQIPDQNKSQEFYLRAFTTFWALRGAGTHLSRLPGRKNLIWVTAGLPLNAIIATEPRLWYQTLDALNDANVAVSVVDSAGVRTQAAFQAQNPGWRGSRPQPTGIGGPNINTQIMRGIAESTGGRAYLGTNNLAGAVRQAVTDSQTVYRLAYRPTHGKWDGAFMRLEVRVRRKGVEVLHRGGYYARPLGPPDFDSRARALDDAITSPLDALEIGLTARFEAQAGGALTIVVTTAPGSLTLENDGGQYAGQFDVRFAFRTTEGATLTDFTDEVPVALDEAEARRAVDEGYAYRRRLTPPAGAASVRVALCDTATGRTGSLLVPLPRP